MDLATSSEEGTIEIYSAGRGIRPYFDLLSALIGTGFGTEPASHFWAYELSQSGVEGIVGKVELCRDGSKKSCLSSTARNLSERERKKAEDNKYLTLLTVHAKISPELQKFAQAYQPKSGD